MVYPDVLKRGDKIAIVSPATIVKREYVEGAAAFLSRRGFAPVIMPGALGPASGSYASDGASRLGDLRAALLDPSVKAILCARGGYGCVHLISEISCREIADNPKWLIGFSDVSALHALWQRAGVASIHGPMAKHLTIEPADDEATMALMRIISESPAVDYTVAGHRYNRPGRASGRLRGGNLAVLNGLSATDFDILRPSGPDGTILFVEDISEAIYAVERMLIRLILSGTLRNIDGLIIGQFTEYRPDRNYSEMEEMIDSLLRRYGISGMPVAFGFPAGHVTYNLPLIEGDYVELCVEEDQVTLRSLEQR